MPIRDRHGNSTKSAQTVKKNKYTLEELLEGMTEVHLHGEIDFGTPVGKEVIEEYGMIVPKNPHP